MRYFRYRFDNGILEATVILVSPAWRTKRKTRLRKNSKLKHTIPSDLHTLSELTSLAINLDTVVKEFFEGSTIEDTVTSGT